MFETKFESIDDLIRFFPDEQSCIDHLEELRWPLFVISPFDASSKVYSCPNKTYKCKKTGKYFNVKTHTLFHNSKIELQKWFTAIWLLVEKKNKMTSVALGKELNVTQKTAWYMIKRIQKYSQDMRLFDHNQQKQTDGDKVSIEAKNNDKLPILEWLHLYSIKNDK